MRTRPMESLRSISDHLLMNMDSVHKRALLYRADGENDIEAALLETVSVSTIKSRLGGILGNRDVPSSREEADGRWMLGSGPSEIRQGPITLHWDTNGVHSVTVRWADASLVSVRGRKSDVTLGDLLRVAQSANTRPPK